ncbi:hypothetical protein DZF91_34765 [Actinomadura logoneensis]|uniref:Uncharacterized protein n=2 Tax=Actinomadura logoneensis TaxID=2293572 RepID=A0A372JAN6_9ACTN|nr:hypothetical protein DZF91_34765 [Actinomadura logoneensis]
MLPAGDASPGREVRLRPDTEIPGEAQWEIRAFGRKTVVICNVESGIFLGFPPGDPAAGATIGGWPKPREWRLVPAGPPSEFLVVASGKRSGDFALDLAPGDDPERPTLRPLPAEPQGAAWTFTRLK